MALFNRWFGFLRSFQEIGNDQEALEALVIPLLVSLMAAMVVISII